MSNCRPWRVRSLKTGVVCHSSETKEGAERWSKKFLGDYGEIYQELESGEKLRFPGWCDYCEHVNHCDYPRNCQSCEWDPNEGDDGMPILFQSGPEYEPDFDWPDDDPFDYLADEGRGPDWL